jgi:hypothetical protein
MLFRKRAATATQDEGEAAVVEARQRRERATALAVAGRRLREEEEARVEAELYWASEEAAARDAAAYMAGGDWGSGGSAPNRLSGRDRESIVARLFAGWKR